MENMEENFPTKFDKRKPKGNHTQNSSHRILLRFSIEKHLLK